MGLLREKFRVLKGYFLTVRFRFRARVVMSVGPLKMGVDVVSVAVSVAAAESRSLILEVIFICGWWTSNNYVM